MAKTLSLYLDDTGTRHPDRKVGKTPAHKRDWFALGGVLVNDGQEMEARSLHAAFCKKWKITYPLHSSDIRAQTEDYRWLRSISQEERDLFYEELYQLIANAPVLGFACTIDRPGYNHRYREKYGRNRWHLCKTAFAIVVERAAKYARAHEARLRVYVEKGDPDADRRTKEYYSELRNNGMPFDGGNSGKYAPLTQEQLKETLYDFKTKEKKSPMSQFADLYAWPLAFGGYKKDLRPYQRLVQDRKVIDCFLTEEEIPHLGCKYSCFDLVFVEGQKNENPDHSGSSAATVG